MYTIYCYIFENIYLLIFMTVHVMLYSHLIAVTSGGKSVTLLMKYLNITRPFNRLLFDSHTGGLLGISQNPITFQVC